MLGYYSCLTGFACSHIVADLFIYSVMPPSTVAGYHMVMSEYADSAHARRFASVTRPPFPIFRVGHGDEVTASYGNLGGPGK